MSKSVLVTGCAGFIGSNFVQGFKTKHPEYKIIGIDDFSSGKRESLDKSIVFYEGSICDEQLLEKIFSVHEPQYLFHFAAIPRVSYSVEHPSQTTNVNVGGTVLLLEKSKTHRVKRFIFSSSSSVYGGAKILPTTEADNPPKPVSPYALQKYVGEFFCKNFSDLYGLDTICLRYFNVFGSGQYGDSPYSTVISAWLEALYITSKRPFLEGDGTQSRDFCYVDNVVQANIKSMEHQSSFNGEVFNIAHGERTDLMTVKKLIEKFTGKRLDLESKPPRVGDVHDTHADISKAREWFGYVPKTNFEKGLEITVKWFESR